MSTTFHSLAVKNIKRETADTVSIAFDLPVNLKSDFDFTPGQYLTLRADINGEDIRRSYSLCSAPFENELRVAVKAIENGVFSNFANDVLKEGDNLDVMVPMGGFKVEVNPSHAKNYIFYAAGSGITPVISMIKAILNAEPQSNVQLYYGNRNIDNTIFKTELDQLNADYINFNLNLIYSRETTGNPLTEGRIDAVKCGQFFEKSQTNVTIDGVYACGPEEMIHCVKDFYTSKGLESNKIHFELFTTSTATQEAAATAATEGVSVDSQVTVIIDDEEYEFELNTDGKDILQAAQDEDADVPFSCKGGVCCTCKAKVMEGTVRMDLNFALEEDEVEDGFILTCQAHPTSEKVVVSFDEY